MRIKDGVAQKKKKIFSQKQDTKTKLLVFCTKLSS